MVVENSTQSFAYALWQFGHEKHQDIYIQSHCNDRKSNMLDCTGLRQRPVGLDTP